jgi:hypothetical protein
LKQLFVLENKNGQSGEEWQLARDAAKVAELFKGIVTKNNCFTIVFLTNLFHLQL